MGENISHRGKSSIVYLRHDENYHESYLDIVTTKTSVEDNNFKRRVDTLL